MSDKLFLIHQRFKYQIVQTVAYFGVALLALNGIHGDGFLSLALFICLIIFGMSNYREGKRDGLAHLNHKEFMHFAAAMLETNEQLGRKDFREHATYNFIDDPREIEVIIRRPLRVAQSMKRGKHGGDK